MGYLSQKKRSVREYKIFFASAVLLSILTILSLFSDSFPALTDKLFLFYLINILLLGYALFCMQIKFALIFLLLILINFFHLSASSHLFFNKTYNGDTDIRISYNATTLNTHEVSGAKGRSWLHFSSEVQASVSEINISANKFKLIMLNFANQSTKAKQSYFTQLKNYIISQDIPVVVIGNFGLSAWQPVMQTFLDDTNLKILNRLIFAKQGSRGNYFNTPTFYVLAFDGFSVKDLSVSAPDSKKDFPVINMLLGFKEN